LQAHQIVLRNVSSFEGSELLFQEIKAYFCPRDDEAHQLAPLLDFLLQLEVLTGGEFQQVSEGELGLMIKNM